VAVGGEGCSGDPEDFLDDYPGGERVWDLVGILDHGEVVQLAPGPTLRDDHVRGTTPRERVSSELLMLMA